MPGKPLYPDILRDDHWQRHKGIIAKVVKGETGVGAALTKLKQMFDEVEWQYFVPDEGGPLPKPRTYQALDQRFEQSKGKRGQLEKVRKEAFAVRDMLVKLGGKWERSLLVPKSTRVHVQVKMAKACETLAQEIKDMDDVGYKRVRAEIDRVEKKAIEMFEGWVERVEKVIPKAKSTPTVEYYNKNMHQQVRGLGTAISKMPQYVKYHKEDDWNDLAGDNAMSGKKDGQEVKEHIERVEKAFKRLKANII